MATTQSQSESRPDTFTVNTQLHGYADGPEHVHVEINPGEARSFMAIVAAGADGRYSFDFHLQYGAVEIEKAFVEGMREPVAELPDWVDCVVDRVEKEMAA